MTTPLERLDAAAPGERWVVRVRRPDGSATDVVGWLVARGPDAVTLAGPVDPLSGEGPQTRVPGDTVLLARRAPAAAGGPDPRRTGADVLEQLAAPAWAGDIEPLGEWTLRAAGGFTGRANACLAVGDPGRPVAEAAAAIEAYAARHGIAPLASVVSGSAEDEALRRLGWRETYVPTQVLAVRLADVLGDRPVDPRVVVDDTLTSAWRAAYDESRPSSADPAAVTAVLEGRPPRAYASVLVEGQVVALGRGHLNQAWLGLAALWVRPGARRQGLGTALVVALGHWAARRGARYAYLQVAVANTEAVAAYARLGFVPHHRYHYREPQAALSRARSR